MKNIQKYIMRDKTSRMYKAIYENLVIWDSHCHIGRDKDGHRLNAEQLIKRMDFAKVNKALVFPLNDPADNKTFTNSNDLVYKAWKKYPDRIAPFFRLNPHFKWREEFNKRVEQGFRGIKLHPRSQRFKLKFFKLKSIYKKAEELGLPILLHAGFGLEEVANDLKEILTSYPKLKLIIGHAGFVDLPEVIKKIAKFDNVLFDTSVVRVYDLFDLLDKVDYRKIVYGSDVPYGEIDVSLETTIDCCLGVRKTANQIRHILGLNIMKWFK